MDKLEELEILLQFKFKNKELLKSALTHKSYKITHKEIDWDDNERLEFLGDSVLNLCTSFLLFQKFKEDKEGVLTQKRANLVCKNTLIKVSKKLKLENYVYLGEREKKLDKKSKENICARTLEAIIGAMFLDGGFEAVLERIKKWFEPYLVKFYKSKIKDPKTQLQELVQKLWNKTPQYEILSISGPSHNPEFEVVIKFNGETIAKAKGKSKKSAEILAAKKALNILKKQIFLKINDISNQPKN